MARDMVDGRFTFEERELAEVLEEGIRGRFEIE